MDGYCHHQAWADFEKILNVLSLGSLTSKMVMLLASSPDTRVNDLTGIKYPVQSIMSRCSVLLFVAVDTKDRPEPFLEQSCVTL